MPDLDLDPARILRGTEWSALHHAFDTADDVPAQLVALFDEAPERRDRALAFLRHTVTHQNTLYPATPPVALYVAAVLPDPRADRLVTEFHDRPATVRAALLRWIGSTAGDANDSAAARLRRHGYAPRDYSPFGEFNALLPVLYDAVAVYLDDADTDTREAALLAAADISDDRRLRHHQPALTTALRRAIPDSASWRFRERAIEALEEWGEDTTGLESGRDPWAFVNADFPLHVPGAHGTAVTLDDPPPF